MVLKFVTQLSSQDAEILRAALAKGKKFAALKDYDFLYKDFAAFLKKTNKEFKTIAELPAFIELGEQTFPNYGLTNDGDGLRYVAGDEKKAIKDISIGFGSGLSSEALHLFMNDIKAGEDVFSTLEIFNDEWATEETYCEIDGLLLDLGAFFNNKTFIYEKAHRFLVYNRKKYSKFLGQAFIDDIILLFSLPPETLQPPKIKILEKSIKKTLLTRKNKQKTWEKLGFCNFYEHGRGKTNKLWKYSGVNLDLWLDEQARLILKVAALDERDGEELGASYYLDNLNRKIFDRFASKNLSDWVNQYLATINFTEQLYALVKTKILLSNI